MTDKKKPLSFQLDVSDFLPAEAGREAEPCGNAQKCQLLEGRIAQV